MSQLRTQVAGETASRQARLEELYLRNAPSALTTAYFLTGNGDLGEDLVQEVFVRVAGRSGIFVHPMRSRPTCVGRW